MCEEPVEDTTSLWKAEENAGRNEPVKSPGPFLPFFFVNLGALCGEIRTLTIL
jgi:hypothetical protein